MNLPPRSPRPSAMGFALAIGLVCLAVGCSSDDTEAQGTVPDLAMTSEEENSLDDDGTVTFGEAVVGAETGGSSSGMDAPPTTEGSGLPPVVVRQVPRGGDPQGIYRGIIGRLGTDDVIAPAIVEPPEPQDGILPLTGLVGEVDDRPAIAVKIDNGPAAHPHTGLNAADIVIEEEVEGGVTRFAAIFHSRASIVGPVRSGRTTDVLLLGGLGAPIMLYSGANEITQEILVDQQFLDLRSEGWSSGFWRDSGRRAPSNLYSDVAPHWSSTSTAGGPPPPQFFYRSAGGAVEGSDVSEFSITYPSSTARWEWTGTSWQRWQRQAQHLLVNGQQVSAANVVVIEADEVATGMTDSSGGAVPEFIFVGSGRAVVFTEGKEINATWTKPSVTSVATLTDSNGRPVELTAGRTWIQLVSDMGALS